MRTLARRLLPSLLLVSACGSEDNYVLSGYAPVTISPVRSAIAAQMTFTDQNSMHHSQWVIAMTDTSDVCTKLGTNPNYFLTPSENYDAAILWVPPGNVGTYILGQSDSSGSSAGAEILVGVAASGGGAPQLTRLPGIVNFGNITLSQFYVGAGGEADGNFDMLVATPGGSREFAGKFKTSYCTNMENAALP